MKSHDSRIKLIQCYGKGFISSLEEERRTYVSGISGHMWMTSFGTIRPSNLSDPVYLKSTHNDAFDPGKCRIIRFGHISGLSLQDQPVAMWTMDNQIKKIKGVSMTRRPIGLTDSSCRYLVKHRHYRSGQFLTSLAVFGAFLLGGLLLMGDVDL